jgi:hypothetical protein
MSIPSWYKEHYPVDVTAIAGEREAIEHSLQKWRGFLPENLNKHKVTVYINKIVDEEGRCVENLDGGYSCALCKLFLKFTDEERRCCDCPIVKSGQLSCYKSGSPYMESSPSDPSLMISALEQTLVWYNSKGSSNAV